jgi:hypothetical protein
MPAVIFDATHLVDGVFVKSWFTVAVSPILAQQASPAVIAKHLRMHTG